MIDLIAINHYIEDDYNDLYIEKAEYCTHFSSDEGMYMVYQQAKTQDEKPGEIVYRTFDASSQKEVCDAVYDFIEEIYGAKDCPPLLEMYEACEVPEEEAMKTY